jgi:tripartite-type tricarboxylate transporter receptor subunit TctC
MALYAKLNFDFQKDIAPIGRVEAVPLVLEVHPSVPAKTVQDHRYAGQSASSTWRRPTSANAASPAGVLFAASTDHVPSKGSTPAITDLVGGQVQVMFDVTVTAMPQIRAGKLRPLGVTTFQRLPFLPDVPTIDSVLKGYEAAGWIGVGAPKGTPPEIIAALNKQTNAMVLDPAFKKRIEDLGAVVAPPNTPAEFAKFITENIEKWKKVIKFAGIKPI